MYAEAELERLAGLALTDNSSSDIYRPRQPAVECSDSVLLLSGIVNDLRGLP